MVASMSAGMNSVTHRILCFAECFRPLPHNYHSHYYELSYQGTILLNVPPIREVDFSTRTHTQSVYGIIVVT